MLQYMQKRFCSDRGAKYHHGLPRGGVVGLLCGMVGVNNQVVIGVNRVNT